MLILCLATLITLLILITYSWFSLIYYILFEFVVASTNFHIFYYVWYVNIWLNRFELRTTIAVWAAGLPKSSATFVVDAEYKLREFLTGCGAPSHITNYLQPTFGDYQIRRDTGRYTTCTYFAIILCSGKIFFALFIAVLPFLN